MTDTTYPDATPAYGDGPYLFTGTDALARKHTNSLVRIDGGAIVFTGASYWCAVTDCQVESLTPLVPKAQPTMEEMILDIFFHTGDCNLFRANAGWCVGWGGTIPTYTDELPTPLAAVRAAWEQVCGQGGDEAGQA
jgi:hypothetical protein